MGKYWIFVLFLAASVFPMSLIVIIYREDRFVHHAFHFFIGGVFVLLLRGIVWENTVF